MFVFKTSKVDNHTINSISFIEDGRKTDVITSLSIKDPDLLVQILNSIFSKSLSKMETESLIEGLKLLKSRK